MRNESRNDGIGNRLLEILPRDEYARLSRRMKRVHLDLRQRLYEPNVPIKHVYFPNSGVVSMVTLMDDGTRSEVATVGKEGMLGLPVFLGAGSAPVESFAQVAGDAWQIEANSFRNELKNGGKLQDVLKLYTQALMNQLARTASCNRVHSIEQRCCRWLLMTHDRVGVDTFHLTQEFLSQMLGVRRATVTEIAQILQKEGLISYARGILTIASRKNLERRVCECYAVVRDEYKRLLGAPW